MRTSKTIVGFLIVLLTAILAQAQGTFQNLNFEASTVPASGPAGLYPNNVSIASALPDWTAYLGGQQVTEVAYNFPPLSMASVCLIGPTWDSADYQGTGFGIIDGNYTVDLETGITPLNPTVTYVNASIAQTGTIPASAESLQFKETSYIQTLSVWFDGNMLLPVALSSGVSADGLPYTLYAANLSAWAGQTGELEFSTSASVNYAYDELDDISFSTTPVPTPEPNILDLTAIAGLAFSARRWLARRR